MKLTGRTPDSSVFTHAVKSNPCSSTHTIITVG
jgi:hypothetical protein